jgi:hypothetical protein
VKDPVRHFLILLCAVLAAYFLLRALRSFGVEAEWRGILAGAAGYMTAGRLASIRCRRKRS